MSVAILSPFPDPDRFVHQTSMCMSLKHKQKRFIPVVVVDVAVPPKVAVATVVRFYSLPPSLVRHVFCQSLHLKCDIYAIPTYRGLPYSMVMFVADMYCAEWPID